MIPKIIHQTAAKTSWEERRLLNRARALMPEFQFRMWSDADVLQLIQRLMPHREQAFLAIRRGVVRADLARCLFLYDQGGIYVDTDYKFLKAIGPELLRERFVLGIEDADNRRIGTVKYGNAFMGSVAGEAMWMDFVETAFDRAAAGEEDPLFIAGPHALSLFLAECPRHLKRIKVMSTAHIYPEMTGKRPDERAYGIHLCWGSWRHKPLQQAIRNRTRRLLTAVF